MQYPESEKTLERKLVARIKRMRGMCIKLHGATDAGLPDRLVLYRGRAYFVELKTTGRRPTPLQLSRHREIATTDHSVYIVDSTQTLELFIHDIQIQDNATPRPTTPLPTPRR